MYDDLVCFQATNISHNIGTDGWVTGIKGLMRCASTSDTEKSQMAAEEKIPILNVTPEYREAQQEIYTPVLQEILGVQDDIVPIPLAPQPDPEEEKKKEADKLKAERDAANRKAKQDEERKKKEAERKQKEKEKQEPKKRENDGKQETTPARKWGYNKVKLKRISAAENRSPQAVWEATVVIFNKDNSLEKAEGKARVSFQDGHTSADIRARQQASTEAKQNAKTLAVATFKN